MDCFVVCYTSMLTSGRRDVLFYSVLPCLHIIRVNYYTVNDYHERQEFKVYISTKEYFKLKCNEYQNRNHFHLYAARKTLKWCV